jgi:F0F1-type ATP synthase delta subunit
LQLPVLVFGVVEVRRLKRELEALEEFMAQSALREPGKQAALPRVSRLLDALAGENHLNLLQSADRKHLKDFLTRVEQHAPTLHISFATDPSSAFTSKIVSWLRANIAGDVLLEVGLQPTIAAGCVVRTTNKIFDMSLRERFSNARALLLESLGTAMAQAPDGAVAAAVPPTAQAAEIAAAQPAPAEVAGPAPGQMQAVVNEILGTPATQATTAPAVTPPTGAAQ